MHQYFSQAWPQGAIALEHISITLSSRNLSVIIYVKPTSFILFPVSGYNHYQHPLVKVSFIITIHLSTPIMEMKHNPHHHFKTAFGSFFCRYNEGAMMDVPASKYHQCKTQSTHEFCSKILFYHFDKWEFSSGGGYLWWTKVAASFLKARKYHLMLKNKDCFQ